MVQPRLAARLLGAHVEGGAERHAGPGQRQPLVVLHLRHAEVDDLDEVGLPDARLDDQVVRLEIAVDDAPLVYDRERGEELPRDPARARRLQRALAPKQLGQAPPAEVLHDQVGRAVLAEARVEDLHDVLVSDGRRGPRLALKAPHRVVVAHQLRMQALERDLAAGHQMLGGVDGAHPAFAEQRPHAVALSEHPADQRAPGVESLPGAGAVRERDRVELPAVAARGGRVRALLERAHAIGLRDHAGRARRGSRAGGDHSAASSVRCAVGSIRPLV